MVKATTRNPAIQQGAEAILELNGDAAVREQIFTRRKALLDYENDISVAESRGEARGEAKGLVEGALKKQKEMVEQMRKNGATEDFIHAVLGDDYKNYALV